MRYRTPLIAGVVGAGALTLVLVGPGSFASFVSATSANQSFKAGTFQLESVAGTPSVSGPLIGDANSIGQPKLSSSTGALPAVPNGNSLQFALDNLNPGDAYTEPVTIYDVGTLQGQVDKVTYTPDASASAQALEQYLTVEVQVQVNGVWTDVHTSDSSGSPGAPMPANAPATFYLDYSFGPQFLQPNPNLYSVSQAQANGFSTNELSTSFRIVFAFTNQTTNPNEASGSIQNQNSAQNVSASPTVSFIATNTP